MDFVPSPFAGSRNSSMTTKSKGAATASCGERPSNVEQLGGPLNSLDTRDPAFILAFRLKRLFALTYGAANTIANLAYAVVR